MAFTRKLFHIIVNNIIVWFQEDVVSDNFLTMAFMLTHAGHLEHGLAELDGPSLLEHEFEVNHPPSEAPVRLRERNPLLFFIPHIKILLKCTN